MTVRNLARIGVTSVLACGALGLAAAPALAADVDLGVDVTGTTLAAGAKVKLTKVTITNKGTTTPATINVVFDLSKLDAAKVQLVPGEGCKTAEALVTCGVDKALLPAPGGSADLPTGLIRLPGTSGTAGKLTVTVKAEGDADPTNDTKTVDITLSPEKGADFGVFVQDVTTANAKEEPTGEPVAPGGIGALVVEAINTGDLAAKGVKVTVQLPAQTTVAQKLDGCRQSADKRTLTCEAPDQVVSTLDGGDVDKASITLSVPVLVSATAKGPVSLKGGTATVTAIKQVSASARSSKAAPAEQSAQGFASLTAERIAKIDADLSDNTDGFAVLVAGPAAGTGGGENEAGQGDGGNEAGQGGGGGLPLTGPAAFAIAGSGLAVLAVGLVLFFSARRRRVVLVTPGDEK